MLRSSEFGITIPGPVVVPSWPVLGCMWLGGIMEVTYLLNDTISSIRSAVYWRYITYYKHLQGRRQRSYFSHNQDVSRWVSESASSWSQSPSILTLHAKYANMIFQWWQGPVYPATIKQLLRAERPHSRSKFSVDGIELGVVSPCVFSSNGQGNIAFPGHLRCGYRWHQ